MKILVIDTSPIELNTSSNQRLKALCEGLSETGHSLTIISPFSSEGDARASLKWDLTFQYIRIDVGNGVNDIKAAAEQRKLKGRILSAMYKAYKKFDIFGASVICIKKVNEVGKRIDQKYDIVISLSDPKTSHFFAGKLIKKLKMKSKWIQYWGDPLLEDITSNTLIPGAVRKGLERRMLENSDLVVYTSLCTMESQRKLFLKYSSKMAYIPTPSDTQIFPFVGRSGLSLGYFGSFYSVARNIIPLYEAVDELKNVTLSIVGDSDLNIPKTERISIKTRVPKDEINQYIIEASVLVCILNKSGTQIPGKIYQLAGTNKEVLLLYDGNNGREICDSLQFMNRFTICENKKDEIKKQINEYVIKGIPKREPSHFVNKMEVAEKLIDEITGISDLY